MNLDTHCSGGSFCCMDFLPISSIYQPPTISGRPANQPPITLQPAANNTPASRQYHSSQLPINSSQRPIISSQQPIILRSAKFTRSWGVGLTLVFVLYYNCTKSTYCAINSLQSIWCIVSPICHHNDSCRQDGFFEIQIVSKWVIHFPAKAEVFNVLPIKKIFLAINKLNASFVSKTFHIFAKSLFAIHRKTATAIICVRMCTHY